MPVKDLIGAPDANFYLKRTSYTSSPPFFNPQPFQCKGQKTSGSASSIHGLFPTHYYVGTDLPAYDAVTTGYGIDVREAQASNKAYSKLIEKINETGDVANEALFKMSETWDLVTKRIITLYHMNASLRKGDVAGFWQQAGFGPTNSRRGRDRKKPNANDFADLWLEYHFGWTNLLHDIYRGLDVLSSKFPTRIPLRGRGSESDDFDYVESFESDTTKWTHHFKMNRKVRVEQGCTFQITNYSEHLLQQVGLANPLAVAWALMPYSFVVDWFVDVQSFILGYTDFVGLQIDNAYTTYYDTASSSVHEYLVERLWNPDSMEFEWLPDIDANGSSTAFNCTRVPGLHLPTLTPKRMNNLSNVRAATAISLLIHLL